MYFFILFKVMDLYLKCSLIIGFSTLANGWTAWTLNNVCYPPKDIVHLWAVKTSRNCEVTLVDPVLFEALQLCVVGFLDVLHKIRKSTALLDPLPPMFTVPCLGSVVVPVEKNIQNRSIWELSIARRHFKKCWLLVHATWTWDWSIRKLQKLQHGKRPAARSLQ